MSDTASIRAFAETTLAGIKTAARHRSLIPTVRQGKGKTTREGSALISFCDNDYLGLAHDPRVISAAQLAAQEWGVGAGASRLVTGDHPLNAKVEEKIAAMKGCESARLFGSGYLANIGTIPVLASRGDRIIMDALVHSCMRAGAQLSGAAVETFRHNDARDLQAKLANAPTGGRTLVLTETVFSMDGDLAPLRNISEVCRAHDAWLMTDDAHGFGVIQQDNRAPVQMGTLSKAIGGYGGYVCGPAALTELLTNRARSLIYTTGLPPPTLGAALEALVIIEAEPERAARALHLTRLFCELTGLPAPQSTIAPLICGEEREALRCSEALRARGFLVTAIRPPTVEPGTARLRITFSTTHDEADIRALASALDDIGALS